MLVRAIYGLLASCGFAFAQTPDVSIVTDVRLSLSQTKDGNRIRFYDPLGRHSTVSLSLNLETGYRVYVSERFARIPNDTMGNQLELAYVEAPGLWRMGYIDLPFGRQFLLRDAGFGAELRTVLLFDNLPIHIATVDNGKRRTRGVSARVGDRIGVSFARGDHFAASATSLTPFRAVEDSPGVSRGFRQAYGVDGRFTAGGTLFTAELVSLQDGHTDNDREDQVIDLTMGWRGSDDRTGVTLGYSRSLEGRKNAYRAEGEWIVNQKVSVFGVIKISRDHRIAATGVRLRF